MKCILVVDDDNGVRRSFVRLLQLYLEKMQIENITVECENVAGAREAMTFDTFDLVISDHSMPVGDEDPNTAVTGLEFLNELRVSGNEVPFILITSDYRNVVDDVKRYLNAHAFPKPIPDVPRLMELVKQLLN